jgi:hypothetical protein
MMMRKVPLDRRIQRDREFEGRWRLDEEIKP